jgi:hypothetical protein
MSPTTLPTIIQIAAVVLVTAGLIVITFSCRAIRRRSSSSFVRASATALAVVALVMSPLCVDFTLMALKPAFRDALFLYIDIGYATALLPALVTVAALAILRRREVAHVR